MDAASAQVEKMVQPKHLPSLVDLTKPQDNEKASMQYEAYPYQIERQITQILLSSPEPETVLEKIARVLGEFFQADACSIAAIASHQASPLMGLWRVDNNLEYLPEEYQGFSALFTNAEPKALALTQATASKLGINKSLRSFLGIKTELHSSVNGTIIIEREVPYAWSDLDKQLLEVVSSWVAMAIAQVQLQRQVRSLTQYQNLLNQLTQAIGKSWDLDRILQLALAGTTQALQVDRALLVLLNYSETSRIKTHSKKRFPKATVISEWNNLKQRLSVIQEENQNSNTQVNYSFLLSESYWCKKAFTNAPEPVVVADSLTLEPIDLGSEKGYILAPSVMPALLVVPLESQSSLLGFFVLQHSQPRPWQPEEIDLVKSVGAQASTAIIHSQTSRQVQELVKNRTAQLKSSLDVQAKLYEKTRQQIYQLRQLNQLKDEFLDNIQHELRTPLTSMSLAIRMLKRSEITTDRRDKYLDILEQQCNQEINLINDLLALQQLKSSKTPINLQKINIKENIQDLAQVFNHKWGNKGLTLAVDLPSTSLMVETDLDSFRGILLELLTNAGKYSEPNTTVQLRVTHQVSRVVLTISNIGTGISPAELTSIFEKFHRGKGVTQKAIQGTGLGLALVKSLVQHINAEIDVKSCPIENPTEPSPSPKSWETCFTLTLPQFFDGTKV